MPSPETSSASTATSTPNATAEAPTYPVAWRTSVFKPNRLAVVQALARVRFDFTVTRTTEWRRLCRLGRSRRDAAHGIAQGAETARSERTAAVSAACPAHAPAII